MNAPALFIFFPLVAGAFLLLFSEKRALSAITAAIIAATLAMIALIFPVNSLIVIGKISIVYLSNTTVFGRTLQLDRSIQPAIAFFFTLGLIWIIFTFVSAPHPFFAPLVLIETALFIAVFAIRPFIFSVTILMIIILLCVPLLWLLRRKSGAGIIRFMFYQTIGLIFLALGGWMAVSVDLNPSDTVLINQTVTLLSLGVVLMLAVFPFSSWLPMLWEESCPIVTGFLISIYQFSILYLLLKMVNSYFWLREFQMLFTALCIIGVIMILIGGFSAFFQNDIQRFFAILIGGINGIFLLLVGLEIQNTQKIYSAYLAVNVLSILLWSVSVKRISQNCELSVQNLRGIFHSHPVLSIAMCTAVFSLTGLPLFAGFPLQIATLTLIFEQSFGLGSFAAVGCWLLIFSAFRIIFPFFRSAEYPILVQETWQDKVIFGFGTAVMILIAFFPQVLANITAGII